MKLIWINDPYVAIHWVLLSSENLLKALCAFSHLIPILILWYKNCYLHFIGEITEVSVVIFIMSGTDSHAAKPELFSSEVCALYPYSYISLMKRLDTTEQLNWMKKLRGVVIHEKYLWSAFSPFFLLSSSQIVFMWCVINPVEEIKHLLLHSVTICWDLTSSSASVLSSCILIRISKQKTNLLKCMDKNVTLCLFSLSIKNSTLVDILLLFSHVWLFVTPWTAICQS